MRLGIIAVALCAVACGKVEKGDVDAGGDGDGDGDGDVDAGTQLASIGDLRGLPDGAVDLLLEDVVVTYTRPSVFHLQVDRAGPSIPVFVGGGNPIPVLVGNTVTLHVTEMTTFQGNKQISGFEILANDNGTVDVIATLAQDLVAQGVAPAEELESELVVLPDASLESLIDNNTYTINYTFNGVSINARMFSPIGVLAGCQPGATFRVIEAVVTEFGGEHQVLAANDGNVAIVDVTACP